MKEFNVASLFAGVVSFTEFKKVFKEHDLKIAYLHNNANLTKKADGTYEAEIVYDKSKYKDWVTERHESVYVGYENDIFLDPLKKFTKEYATDIYNYLLKNIDDTNYYESVNGIAGSKAFYK